MRFTAVLARPFGLMPVAESGPGAEHLRKALTMATWRVSWRLEPRRERVA
jgi:hypothetical protein